MRNTIISQQGHISLENLPPEMGLKLGSSGKPFMDGELNLQTAEDGRIWVNINGICFLRFKPKQSAEFICWRD